MKSQNPFAVGFFPSAVVDVVCWCVWSEWPTRETGEAESLVVTEHTLLDSTHSYSVLATLYSPFGI